jgi:hypothetical protein
MREKARLQIEEGAASHAAKQQNGGGDQRNPFHF